MLKVEKDAELVRNRKTIKDRKISKREREEIRRKEFSFFRSFVGHESKRLFLEIDRPVGCECTCDAPSPFPGKERSRKNKRRERLKTRESCFLGFIGVGYELAQFASAQKVFNFLFSHPLFLLSLSLSLVICVSVS
jgi:hypothetical protein